MRIATITLTALLAPAFLALSFKGDKDPLNKRKFSAQVTEFKEGKAKPGKAGDDEIDFKNGRVFSLFCFDKFEFKEVKYAVNKDSTYDDEGESKHYLEIEAITTNEKNETINMNFTIDDNNIEGSYKLIKKDIVKKSFTFIGSEKGGKDSKKKK